MQNLQEPVCSSGMRAVSFRMVRREVRWRGPNAARFWRGWPCQGLPRFRATTRSWSTISICRCPEVQDQQSSTALESNVGTVLGSVFSVMVTGQGTIIHYDH
jgi:hypothetical protein